MKFIVLLLLMLAFSCAFAAGPVQKDPLQETPAEKAKRLKWFTDARFGMFIHFGLYAIPAGKWGNSDQHGEWIRETAQIPIPDYEKFQAQFNPVNFDAEKICKTAKDAGMKYIVITTKHHDGFCLYDSQYTDWDVMNSPYGKDLMKQLAAACKKYGLKMCWYHSIMDWHHPDYLPKRSWEKLSTDGADFNRYFEYLKKQVTELLTNYGPIGIMWFDGEWEATWNHDYGKELYALCRRLQPNVIVNNRVDVGRAGMSGFTEGDRKGDYGTPEQEIPATGMPGQFWETCMTLNGHWGYCSADTNWKTPESVIHMLCDIASKGGNYLLNVGPTALGEIPSGSLATLEAVGKWMKVNGEAIYGSSASPFKKLPWGRATVKKHGRNSSLYLHVFDWPSSGLLSVEGLANKVNSAKILGGGNVEFDPTPTGVTLHLPKNAPTDFCGVVKLDILGDPVIYSAPEFQVITSDFVGHGMLNFVAPGKGLTIRYELGGKEPNANSSAYSGSVEISKSTKVQAQMFQGKRPVSAMVSMEFRKVDPMPAVYVDSPNAGLSGKIYRGSWDTMPDFSDLKSDGSFTMGTIGIVPEIKGEYIGCRISGVLDVPETAMWAFALGSDDGSKMWIDGKLIVNHDGLHSYEEKMGFAALLKGKHIITIEWFNKTGGAELSLHWGTVGNKGVPIPASALKH